MVEKKFMNLKIGDNSWIGENVWIDNLEQVIIRKVRLDCIYLIMSGQITVIIFICMIRIIMEQN